MADDPTDKQEDEAERIKAMMAAASAEWSHPRGAPQPSSTAGGGRGHGAVPAGRGAPQPSRAADIKALRTPPPGYICFRCNLPGHFIQHCEASADELASAPRRAPTGIPPWQLRAVEAGTDAKKGFVMPDGTIAVIAPDEKKFEKARQRRTSALATEAEVPDELRCPVSHGLFVEPVVLPCCGASVSNNVIDQALVEAADGSSTCVLCNTANVAVLDVVPNKQMREALRAYLDDVRQQSGGAPAAATAGATEVEPAVAVPTAAPAASPAEPAASVQLAQGPAFSHRYVHESMSGAFQESCAGDAAEDIAPLEVTAGAPAATGAPAASSMVQQQQMAMLMQQNAYMNRMRMMQQQWAYQQQMGYQQQQMGYPQQQMGYLQQQQQMSYLQQQQQRQWAQQQQQQPVPQGTSASQLIEPAAKRRRQE